MESKSTIKLKYVEMLASGEGEAKERRRKPPSPVPGPLPLPAFSPTRIRQRITEPLRGEFPN